MGSSIGLGLRVGDSRSSVTHLFRQYLQPNSPLFHALWLPFQVISPTTNTTNTTKPSNSPGLKMWYVTSPTQTHRVTFSGEAFLTDVANTMLVSPDCSNPHSSVSTGLLWVIFLNFHSTQNSDTFFEMDKLFCRKVSNPASYSFWITLLLLSFPRLVSLVLPCLFSAVTTRSLHFGMSSQETRHLKILSDLNIWARKCLSQPLCNIGYIFLMYDNLRSNKMYLGPTALRDWWWNQ